MPYAYDNVQVCSKILSMQVLSVICVAFVTLKLSKIPESLEEAINHQSLTLKHKRLKDWIYQGASALESVIRLSTIKF